MKILLDLDGTLTHTNGSDFDEIKYGRDPRFRASDIPVIPGATAFINKLKTAGHTVTIISDSHHAYVEKMASEIFGVSCLTLADKPNSKRLRDFLIDRFAFQAGAEADYFVVGDSKLDIHMARQLELTSVLLDMMSHKQEDYRTLYKARATRMKHGSTYYCRTYEEVLRVLDDPISRLMALEHKAAKSSARFLNELNKNGGLTMFRGLARQHQGLCDQYGALERYYGFQSQTRSDTMLREIAEDVSRYVANVVLRGPDKYSWDYITCVADKVTTRPPRKMEAFLEALDVPLQKIAAFSWPDHITGSIREHKSTAARYAYVEKSVSLREGLDLTGKSIIVLDDQYTTGATADCLSSKLIEAGAVNILFLALFYLVDDVGPELKCPRCGKDARIKTRKSDGGRFYSCPPVTYGGTGCGWIRNLE